MPISAKTERLSAIMNRPWRRFGLPCVFGFLLCASAFPASDLVISRIARPTGFMDVVGEKAALFGLQDGSLEGFVYPLKLFRDLRFSFGIGGKLIPQSAVTQRVMTAPGHVDLILTGDEFEVTERLIVPVGEPGGIIRLSIHTYSPLTIHLSLVPDFQLMWPAAFGSSFASWSPEKERFVFGADGQPYAAVLSGPELKPELLATAGSDASTSAVGFSLGTVEGTGLRTLAFAGSVKSLARHAFRAETAPL